MCTLILVFIFGLCLHFFPLFSVYRLVSYFSDFLLFKADVIETCSRASSVLERYEVIVLNKPRSTIDDPAAPTAVNQESHIPQQSSKNANDSSPDLLILTSDAHQDLLSQDLLNLGIDEGLQPLKSQTNSDLINDFLNGPSNTSGKCFRG